MFVGTAPACLKAQSQNSQTEGLVHSGITLEHPESRYILLNDSSVCDAFLTSGTRGMIFEGL